MYRALYRKWRPQRFEDVVGQQNIVAALQNQVASGRVGHAYLFTGTRGTGKTSCAKIFAKAINCPDSKNGDPCCRCAVCRGIDDGSVVDVMEIDAASNNGVDNIRDLRDETAYVPTAGAYRVYIIDEVHMLSNAAFNALLKTLEEPPAHVVFILATTDVQKVPATILSRCQRYDFGRIRPQDIARRVEQVAAAEDIPLTEGAAGLIARLADGAMRDALSILDTCAGLGETVDEALVRRMAGVTDRSYLFTISDALAGGSAAAALEQVALLRQQSTDMRRLCEELIAHYRNLLLACLPGGKDLLTGVPPEEEAAYLERGRDLDQSGCIRAIRLLGEGLNQMIRGSDGRVELELALFSIAQPAPAAAPAAQPAPAAKAAPAPFASASPAPSWKPAAPARQESAPAPAGGAAATPAPDAQSTAPAPEKERNEPPAEAGEPLPWDAPEAAEQKEIPLPAPRPERPRAPAPASAARQPQPFADWPRVLEALKAKDHMLTAFLKGSRAFYDGRRVLIDGGDLFRDFIRQNKDSQALLKGIIRETSGLQCGIGPYTPSDRPAEGGANVQQALEELAARGVDVVYNEKG